MHLERTDRGAGISTIAAMTLHYREGSIDDIEDVFRLNRLVFDEAWSKDVMLQSLRVGYDLYVCYQETQLVGYVLSQDILFESQVMQLGVHLDYRRMGVARQLMQMLIDDKKGMEAMLLEVRASNAGARLFYAQLGFVEAGQRPGYYAKTATKPREDAVLMSLDLQKSMP